MLTLEKVEILAIELHNWLVDENDEPLDGDETQLIANQFLAKLDSLNGNE